MNRPQLYVLMNSAIFLLLTYATTARAEPSPLLLVSSDSDDVTAEDAPRPDALFPSAGRPSVTLASGVPFVALGEAAIGVSDGFAIGAMAGLADTADEVGVGLRPRFKLTDSESFDVALALPVLFYPPSDKRDRMSWLLTNPALFARGHIDGGPSLYGGIGAVLTTCPHDLAGAFSDAAHHDEEGDGTSLNGAWNTFHAGAALPVSGRASVFIDTMAMMEGIKPATSYNDKIGPPFLAQLGVSWAM